MRIDGDDIWKPGYDGPPPFVPPAAPGHESSPTAGPKRGRRRLAVLAAGALGAGAMVGVFNAWSTTDVSTTDVSTQAIPDVGVGSSVEVPDDVRVIGQAFAGADERRLPAAFDSLWRRPLEASDDMWVEVVGRRDVVVARGLVARGTSGNGTVVRRTSIDVLDAGSGTPRWSLSVDVGLRSVAFVAAFDDVLVFHLERTIRAVDAATGADRWSRDVDSEPSGTDIKNLAGTDFLALAEGADDVALLDGRTGVEVGQFAGPVIATDAEGNWFVERGDDIVKYDLRNGFAAATIVASGVGGDVASVVDGQAVASGALGWRTARTSGEWVPYLRPLTDEADRLPTPASSIIAVAGPTFLASGLGVIAGVELDEDRLSVGWTREGIITMTTATERGIAAVVATEGGAAQSIVDGRTGNTIVVLEMGPGTFDVLRIVGNGVITRRSSSAGLRIAALDLDGRELWSMPNVAEAAVGDRIVVYPEFVEDGSLVLVAVGDLT